MFSFINDFNLIVAHSSQNQFDSTNLNWMFLMIQIMDCSF